MSPCVSGTVPSQKRPIHAAKAYSTHGDSGIDSSSRMPNARMKYTTASRRFLLYLPPSLPA
ncbi:hypothetical protein D3C72_2149580 [compost metagenome]